MTTSNTTLASLWQDEGHASAPSTPSKSELKDDFIQYYRHAGLEPVAKEAGLIDANGDLFRESATPTKAPIHLVALPITSTGSPAKMVQQQTILPKSILGTSPSSPMILSTNTQRTVNAQQIIASGTRVAPVLLDAQSPAHFMGQIRKRAAEIEIEISDSKRKKGEKGGKGLRHFSMKVCEKVQRKGVTSYNEVADELVAEFSDPRHLSATDQQYDQKNIRRRVYDALNVLMAMNIISKEKKEIKWIGLPTNSAQECQNLEVEKQRRLERIRHKTQQLQELILQQIAFKNLVNRNRELEKSQGPPTANSAIQLPFIIVNTSKKTVIDCSISNDKYEYLFNFDNTFEIHDDIEVLKRMGMAFGLEKGQCAEEDVSKAVKMVPKALEPYVLQLAGVQSSSSIMAGPSGVKTITPVAASSRGMIISQSPITTQDSTDVEVAMATSQAASRRSSIGSYSDIAPSRGATDTPSEVYSDSESERSSPVEIS